ncbi:MAG: acetyl-CoA C-acyltransferase [Deltaproteobacteria bacterium]|nr:acetyl-CoA C-acyltransferase [Deltaproteobacteria bacterium]
MTDALIIDAVRSPRGKRNGSLSLVHPIDLATVPLTALVERNKFNPKEVSDVLYGCVSQRAEQDNVIAREAVLAAGWPLEVAGVSLNRFCGSGLTAVNFAAQAVMAGQEDLIIGGGVEHMSRVPMNIDFKMEGSLLDQRFPHLVSQGISAEMVAEKYGYSRSRLDEFAARSQSLAAKAWEEGRFKKSIVPVKAKNQEGKEFLFEKDEHFRPGTTAESLAKLKTVFKADGVIHAGNSSGIVDGAAAVLIASPNKAKELGLKPRAKIIATSIVGSDPIIMLLGPGPAIHKALKKANLKVQDIDLWEINEAFAPVPLAVAQDLEIDLNKINVNGGAIALGHPLGATGAILLGTALDELERQNKRYACITLCIGFGMGVATIIERV